MLLSQRRQRIAAVVGLFAGTAALVLSSTCTESHSSDGADAGSDGGLDARPVTRGDAETPSPWHDAGPRDAGYDAAPPVYRDAGLAEIEWERYPIVSDDCVIERAVDPSQVFFSRWEPCPGAESLCQQLVVDWTFERWQMPDARTGNAHTGEYGYWPMLLEYPGWGDADLTVLATTRGAPIAALRHSGVYISPGVNEVIYAYAVLCTDSVPKHLVVYFGSPDGAFGVDVPAAVIDADAARVTNFQEPAATQEQVVGVVQPEGFLFAVRRTGETRRIDGFRSTSVVQTPRLVSEHLLWNEFGARWSVIHEAPDGTVEPFIELPDADVRVFESDGARMLWVQSYPPGGGSSYVRHEIWTAPYVRDARSLSGATRVLTVDDHRFPLGGGRLRGDRYAFVRRPEGAPPSLELLNVSTGELRRFLLPPHREEMNPWVMYLSDTEAMVKTGARRTRVIPMRVDLTRIPVVSP